MMPSRRQAVIGSDSNFWLHSTVHGFDLTHPSNPDGPVIYPRVPLDTTTARVTIDPARSALVIVDMQNFFLSPSLGRPRDSKGLSACDRLTQIAIPACRKARIRIVWLNWGLTQQDIEEMPPATLRAFGFETVRPNPDHPADEADGGESNAKTETPTWISRPPTLNQGLGSQIGSVVLDDGHTVDAGRLLMRHQWNTALYPALEEARQAGLSENLERQDAWIHKNRMSGLWGAETEATKYLESHGIKTLIWAGVNTDQCVGGSLQDAFTKGYDCLLLSDGCGTTSPEHARQCVEYNTAKIWGFVLGCEDLAKGVENTQYS